MNTKKQNEILLHTLMGYGLKQEKNDWAKICQGGAGVLIH